MAETIILDPGHGGIDPGAVYNGRRESDDNLRLAMAVGNLLDRKPDIEVVYTPYFGYLSYAVREGSDCQSFRWGYFCLLSP